MRANAAGSCAEQPRTRTTDSGTLTDGDGRVDALTGGDGRAEARLRMVRA